MPKNGNASFNAEFDHLIETIEATDKEVDGPTRQLLALNFCRRAANAKDGEIDDLVSCIISVGEALIR